jgi:hypothetical protein
MNTSSKTNFGYHIAQDAEGWRWMTLDDGGAVHNQGLAPDRSLAAAFVIRALLRRELRPQSVG